MVEREFPPIFDIFRATSLDKEWNPPPLRVLIRSANNELAPGRRVRPIPLDRAGCTEKGAPRTTFARKFDKAERGIRAHSCMHTLHASKGDRLCCDTSVKYRSSARDNSLNRSIIE